MIFLNTTYSLTKNSKSTKFFRYSRYFALRVTWALVVMSSTTRKCPPWLKLYFTQSLDLRVLRELRERPYSFLPLYQGSQSRHPPAVHRPEHYAKINSVN